jgi:hypothetical protein
MDLDRNGNPTAGVRSGDHHSLNQGGTMRMHKNRHSRLIGALVAAVAAISIAVPATAGAAPVTEPAQVGAVATEHAQPASSTTVLRRDGSQAVPFVASAGSTTGGSFNWGDAAIGAGAITGVVALGLGGILGGRRLKSGPHRQRMPAATSS